MMSPTLEFLANDAGEEEGLNDAGIETYRSAPYASLARECAQNSLDAGTASPVILRIDLINIPIEELPSLAAYRSTFESCLTKAVQNGNEKEIEFFNRACELLHQPTLPVLRVSDFNTTGLIGPSVPQTPFHTMLKGAGVSANKSTTSSGSYGIGKNAAFAVSELQTVFYSTVYEPKCGGRQFLAQGKSILISHVDSQGKAHRARGYWGAPGFEPVNSQKVVPVWLRRDLPGTSVFAIGFQKSEHWQYKIAASLIRNFFCAILRGTMEFLVDDEKIRIDKSSLSVLFQNAAVLRAADESNQSEDFYFSRDLFVCLTSPQAIQKELDVAGIGRMGVRILVREGLPKRLCIVRNGMVITDNLTNFGHKFASFPMYKDFVALVEPLDSEASALIKRLENPRHDELSAERIPDAAKRFAAEAAMKRLAIQIRAAIKDETLPKVEDQISLDELSEFFADKRPSDSSTPGRVEENLESYTYTPMVRNDPPLAPRPGGQHFGRGGAGHNNGRTRTSGSPGSGIRTGPGKGGRGSKSGSTSLSLQNVRNMIVGDGSGASRRLFFTSPETGRVSVGVEAVGMNDPEPLPLANTDRGSIRNGTLVIDVVANERVVVNLDFRVPYRGPIELAASKEVIASEASE